MVNNIVRIEVHKNLQEVLEKLRFNVANDMKKKYSLGEISIPRTLSSQILAAQINGKKVLDIKVRKTGPGRGVLELF